MKSGRDKKIAEEIRREASRILNFELSDPRVSGATVTTVRVTPDLKTARIYFAMPGCEERKGDAEKGLKKSAGYVRHLIAERIRIKFMPQIEFFYDESLEIESKLKDLFASLPADDRG
jgi:ribosome-binding factor A